MYILIDPQVLEDKGLHYYEKMPDGRAIAETNLLKVLGSVKSVEFVSTTAELNEMRRLQQEALDKQNTIQPSPEQQEPQQMEELTPSTPITPEQDLSPDNEMSKS